ncbi:adenine deaminase [Desulfobacterales bacterium HSG16]|nr:adenine deaminase [Desulfobacterales bacterium HSG16]
MNKVQMDKIDIVKAAGGIGQVDLLLKNCNVVDVFSGQIRKHNIAIFKGYIVGFGEYDAKKIIDIENRYVAPGFIDAHVHIESSMTDVSEFARTVLARGTTTVVADPHEIANVLGTEGLSYMIESARNQPMNIYFGLPSCVPATFMETAGAALDARSLQPFLKDESVVALGEMMNYPGVIHTDLDVMKKIGDAQNAGKPVDGHAPGLSGKELDAYIAAGISSDHECTTRKEAEEKLSRGMYIMIREGTGAKNLDQLAGLVNAHTASRIMWCTDDRHPNDLIEKGHIDFMIEKAIQKGIDPVMAIKIATLNPALYFGLEHLGGIAPGKQADLVIFSKLEKPEAETVFCKGVQVAENKKILPDIRRPVQTKIKNTMNAGRKEFDLSIPATGSKARVIEIVPGQIITNHKIMEIKKENGLAVSDIDQDILKIAVIERHKGTGSFSTGFVKGFGLKKGALGSSVAHDSHNIIIVGVHDKDMKAVLKEIVSMGGGMAAVSMGESDDDSSVIERLALPIAGLMSDRPVSEVKSGMDSLIQTAADFGSTLNDPFMILSFLALPVIPELKITDKGLVDVVRFKITSLFPDSN